MSVILQNIIFPNLDVKATEASYIRRSGEAACNLGNRSIDLPKGSSISLDTFYNSFDISFWKKYTEVNSLILRLRGTGLVRVAIYVANIGQEQAVDEVDIDLSKSNDVPIKCFEDNDFGKICIRVRAITDAVLSCGCFLTNRDAVRDVKLGIVITHYNRKQYVIPAIKRIERELTTLPKYKEKINLVVVDNSQNILPEEVGNTTLIKNENLGGSGGFTRGLLYLKDNGYSHCLFADDDGSFEIDSIKRTYAIYSYLKEEFSDVALSGVMLHANRPNIILEKGGFTDGTGVYPNKAWLDINRFWDVLIADDGFGRMNYGAWCFFCFSLKHMKKWPFPFFVRGDDVLFSLQNEFRIITICGIACYIDEYEPKESPLTKYLAYRGWYMNWLLVFWKTRREAIREFSKWCLCSLFSYQYESVEAILMSQNDLLEGGKVFLDDLYLKKTREKISKLTVTEKHIKDACTFFAARDRNDLYESKLTRLIRFASLQGLFIPEYFFKPGVMRQDRGWRAIFRQTFLYKKIFFYCPYDQKGYVVTHNKKKLLVGLFMCAKMVLKTFFYFNSSKRELSLLTEKLATEQFWRETLLE